MAIPLVAGCAAVLRQALMRYHSDKPAPFPTAALVKALLLNGADILEPPKSRFVPIEQSGFGRVNIANALAVVEQEPGTWFYEHELTDSLDSWSDEIDVKILHTSLTVTLVWSDPPCDIIKNELHLQVGEKYAIGENSCQQIV